jgi:hypothetical protein
MILAVMPSVFSAGGQGILPDRQSFYASKVREPFALILKVPIIGQKSVLPKMNLPQKKTKE